MRSARAPGVRATIIVSLRSARKTLMGDNNKLNVHL
jgi:hypothetical protein